MGTPLEINDFVKPVTLPKQGQSTSGKCVVTGWGYINEDSESPKILQKVEVPTISDEECREVYGSHVILDSNLCCGYPEGGKDACREDSGGPLYCNGYLAGVVSWGHGCGRPNYPGVYTEVSYYVDWIYESIKLSF